MPFNSAIAQSDYIMANSVEETILIASNCGPAGIAEALELKAPMA
jgi:hypothetical protein